MTLYSSEMCSNANTRRYYVEVRDVETGEVVFEGRGCKTPSGARRATIDDVAMMFDAVTALEAALTPAGLPLGTGQLRTL